MACQRIWALALLAAALAMPTAHAGPPPAQPDDAARLAAKIDDLIGAGYVKAGVRPAAPADDAVLLRRLSLDTTGRIPLSMDVRRFLNDRSPDKRRQAIERLLDSPGYAYHFSNIWRDLLLPEAKSDIQKRYLTGSIESWLLKQFNDNVPYDQMVRELITLPMPDAKNRMNIYQYYNGGGQRTPMAFYLAKQGKPEELAAATSRLFLGVRLECAQCHDHPFAQWTREQFWNQAAFFAGIRSPRGGNFFNVALSESLDRREMSIPKTDRVAQARFLDDTEPRWRYKVSARTTYADWLTRPDNPFFARAAVNRMWEHFFGVGLVDPVDDFSDKNMPSHPELLDELARQFAAHNFDFKFLVRAIALSKTYQLSSSYDGPAPDVRLFARMPIRGLTGEQVYDSLARATGLRDNIPRRQRFFYFGNQRQEFIDKFAAQEKLTEFQTAIPQALTLMNGTLINNAVHPERGEVLSAIASSTFMTTTGKIEALYLASLSRKPRSEELARFTRYVDSGGAANNRNKALADVFWVLLNSPEFIQNH